MPACSPRTCARARELQSHGRRLSRQRDAVRALASARPFMSRDRQPAAPSNPAPDGRVARGYPPKMSTPVSEEVVRVADTFATVARALAEHRDDVQAGLEKIGPSDCFTSAVRNGHHCRTSRALDAERRTRPLHAGRDAPLAPPRRRPDAVCHRSRGTKSVSERADFRNCAGTACDIEAAHAPTATHPRRHQPLRRRATRGLRCGQPWRSPAHRLDAGRATRAIDEGAL